jgi:tetratricopeptide (TPR) repeat protein
MLSAFVAVSGCAVRDAGLTSRSVKPADPSVSNDSAESPAPPPALSEYVRKLRALQSRGRPKNSLQPTIESSNPALTRALLLLAVHESPAHHRLAAAEYRKAGVLDYAYRHFQRATVLAPCDAASYDGMARLWRDWGMPDFALSDVYRALNCNQRSAEIYNTLGTVLESLGQLGNAEQAYQRALAIDSGAAYALNNLCYLAMNAGDGATAARLCEQALAAAPDFGPARNNLALVQARRGDFVGAEARLRAGVVTSASLYNVGILRLTAGRYAEAALVFDQALAAQPSMRIAHQRSVQARNAARAAEQAR